MTRQSVILIISLLMISCGGDKTKDIKPRERVFEVKTTRAVLKEYRITYTTSGRFEAVDLVKIRPEIPARVEKIFFEEGQEIKKGETLLKLEGTKYRRIYEEILAKKEQVERDLENAQEIYERRESLYKKKLIGEEEFKSALTRVEVLKAQLSSLNASLSRALLDLEKTQVRTPVDGIVQKRLVSEGEYVTPQNILYEILGTERMRFSFKLPPRIAMSMEKNHPIEIHVLNRKIKARVEYVSPSADASGMFLVKAYLQGKELKPNLYAEVSFNFGKVKSIKVPESAVQISSRQTFLWVVRNSRVVKVPVEVVSHQEGEVLVKGDIKEGDKVVVEGFISLYEGARVKER